MKNVIAVFAVLLFSIANQSIYAQSGLCTSPTPFYEVDLTGFPDGTAALPNDSRAGLCCDASWPLRCIEVEITLDPAAVGIIFDIEDGAQPTGSMFYQINCGEEIPVGNEICLDGVGPHTLTFCKPGNNQNSFIIRSIPGIGSPEDVDVNIGCDIRLEMAGLIPETITWNDITSGTGQYNDYLSCQSGCDVTYVLPTFPAPEFIDYEVCGTPISNLCQLVADPYCDTVRVYTNLLLDITAAEICDGDSYLLPDGQFVGDSGTYEVVLTSVDGCDSVLTTELTVHPSFFEEQDEVLCDGQTYTLPDGTSVSNSGTYLTNLLTTEGCDSIISTSLVFNPNFSFEFDVEICEGENFTLPDGSVVTDAGTYPILLSTQAGCDSLLTYNLTVNENYFLEVEATICDDENFTLPDGSIVTDPGVYTVSFLSERNCDSTIQTTLTVNPTHLVVEDVIICDDDTYTLPDGQVVNGSGVYITNLISSLGCDSVVRTNLTVNATFFEQVDVEICDNETYELPDGTTVTAGGTYPVTLSSVSGCDSVIETRLTVQPTFNNTVQAEICDNETYTLPDGAQVNAPGSYTSSLITTFGCDSIITTQLTVQPTFFLEEDIAICNGDTYTLPDGRVVNATGSYTSDLTTVNGCDSTIRSNVLVQPTYFEQRVAEICDTDSFILPDGSSVNSSGVYPITLTSVSGCDSTIETTLTVHPSFDISQQAVICDNETYVLPDGNAVNTPGMYVSNLITTEGCDSIVRTELTVNPTYFSSETIEICDGDSYVLPDGTMVNAEGIFTSELLSVSGCDSVINTQVIVNEVNAVSEDASICVGDSYTLPDGTVVTAAGSYSSTLLNQFGCDSVITTSLSLLPILTSTEDVSICSGETYMLPDGTSVSSTGTYSSTVTASFGCDSIITTNLNVIPEFFTDISAEICDGESYSLPDGTNVTTSGIYPITLASAAGCDSTVTTTLDVNPSYFTQLDETICANQTFTLPSGQVVNQPGIYTSQYLTDRGCDSIIVINLAVDPVYATPQNAEICSGETFMLPDGTEVSSAGVYVTPLSSQAGCDS
ncbi:MAG: hypothetical protein KTR13_00790, partial [Saprospiraceae bacterium]|nr:hypothetical protein [Saprospiraceae bacterium]